MSAYMIRKPKRQQIQQASKIWFTQITTVIDKSIGFINMKPDTLCITTIYTVENYPKKKFIQLKSTKATDEKHVLSIIMWTLK